jgi:ABC-2 type transport system permease protein
VTAFETIFLVARREIRERLRSKTFLVSTALLLLLVGVSTIANGMIETTKTYGVVSTMNTPQLERALQQTAAPFDATVRLRVAPLAAARQELAAKKTDAVLDVEHDRLLFREGVNKKLAAIADTAVRIVRGHVPAKAELAVTTLEPAKEQPGNAETLVAVIGSLLVLLALAVYGQWVVVGVVEGRATASSN